MKILTILLILSSCASFPTCKKVRTESFYGTKYVEFQCQDSMKYCKYGKDNKKIDCFSTRQK